MKRFIILNICVTLSYLGMAQTPATAVQASPSNLNAPANAQPVPNSNAVEKGAPTAKPLIAPPANPVPPIYPGAEAKSYPTQTNLIYPAAPQAPTQPMQKEPLTPVEATNILQPNRPFRDEQSRTVPAVGIEKQVISPVTKIRTEPVKKVVAGNKTYSVVTPPKPAPRTIPSDVTPSVSAKETIAMKMDGSIRSKSETGTTKRKKHSGATKN